MLKRALYEKYNALLLFLIARLKFSERLTADVGFAGTAQYMEFSLYHFDDGLAGRAQVADRLLPVSTCKYRTILKERLGHHPLTLSFFPDSFNTKIFFFKMAGATPLHPKKGKRLKGKREPLYLFLRRKANPPRANNTTLHGSGTLEATRNPKLKFS